MPAGDPGHRRPGRAGRWGLGRPLRPPVGGLLPARVGLVPGGRARTHFPLFQEITTAYHEGFPGHHLQIGVQVARSAELSRFHRLAVWYPGSGEGWALYAEHLMGELGYLERPEYVVGLLSSQLFRACRVAIDIGMPTSTSRSPTT